MRQNGGGLMVAVPAPFVRRKARDDHIGPQFSDHPDGFPQDFPPVPKAQRLVRGFGKTEVDGGRKKLLATVDFPRLQQFLRADEPEFDALFRPDEVLAAVPAGQRQVGGPYFPLVGQVGDQPGVLVVRVRGEVQHRAQDVQPLHLQQDVRRRLRSVRLAPGNRDRQQENEYADGCSFHAH